MNKNDPSPREESMGAAMAIAYNLMKNKHQRAIISKGFEITMEQFAVLEVLVFHGDMNMSSLANRTWKHNANITRIVDKLEKRKLLLRKAIQGDRRAHLISVTNQGVRVFENVIPVLIETNKQINSCLTDKEELIVRSAMKKIIKHLSED